MKGYPVPDRQRWHTMIQHLDGTQIAAVDDADALDRWRRLNWATPDLTPSEWQERIAGYARAVFDCGLIGITGTTDPTTFLDALAAEGVIQVSRK